MREPMHLGINTLFLVPGDVGGTETYLRETLLACLQEFPEVRYTVFTNNENDGLLRTICAGYDAVAFDCLGFNAANRPLRIILEQTKLPLAVRRHKLDLLWSPGYTAPLLASCKQAVTVCDLQYKSYPEDMSILERVTLDFLVRGACRRCSAVLAISEFSRREIVRHGFAAPEHVHAVLLGVDPSFAIRLSDEERERYLQAEPFLSKTPFLLCVAHTYPHKMVHMLVESFIQIMDRIPHKLVLVGSARRGEDLVERALENCPDRSRIVRFRERVPYRKLQLLYQSADMFILPSAYEGFGLPVLEAMMAGIPVITSGEASLPEVAGNHAFLMGDMSAASISEQILRVQSLTSEDRRPLVERARNWAQTFTWQRSVRDMFCAFQSLVT